MVAVNAVADGDVPDEARAVTHWPALTADMPVVMVWLNFVEPLQDTATWPLCWLCTCIVVPETAATVPDAAGAFCPPPGREPSELDDGVPAGCGADVLPEDELPQAVKMIAASSPETPRNTSRTGPADRREWG